MKGNRGAISVFALLAMLFFLIFIMIVYNNIASKAKMQIETTEVLVDTYKSSTDSTVILNQMMAGDLNSSNIKTEAQNNVSSQTGKFLAIDGKIYNIK